MGTNFLILSRVFFINKDYYTCTEIWECIERGDIAFTNTNTQIQRQFLNAYIMVIEKTNTAICNIDRVKEVGIFIMAHIRSALLKERGMPWIHIIPSVHQMRAHGWGLYKLNKGRAISVWAETPIESWNKTFALTKVELAKLQYVITSVMYL